MGGGLMEKHFNLKKQDILFLHRNTVQVMFLDCLFQMIGRELFEEAINELSKEDVVARTGEKIRLIKPVNW